MGGMINERIIIVCTCNRCGREWTVQDYGHTPQACPRCHSKYWNTESPYKQRRGKDTPAPTADAIEALRRIEARRTEARAELAGGQSIGQGEKS